MMMVEVVCVTIGMGSLEFWEFAEYNKQNRNE